jgi:hypothetical protein
MIFHVRDSLIMTMMRFLPPEKKERARGKKQNIFPCPAFGRMKKWKFFPRDANNLIKANTLS